MEKSVIRNNLLKVRKNKFFIKYDQKKVINFILDQKINIIGGYFPINYEFNCLDILDQLSKKVSISLPIMKKHNQMDFYTWKNNDPLKINNFGIPEPVNSTSVYPDILLVPLVGFDKNLNRIGYGGGYYDRYIMKIKSIKKILTIGLAFSFQEIKKVPIDTYDQKLNFIYTEKGFL